MRLRAVRPFRWAGEHVEPGTLLNVVADDSTEPRGPLTVSLRDASRLVYGYGDCVFVDEREAGLKGGMVVNGDPVVETRDPIAAPNVAGPRRRRS
jgi:hypothetical protein